MENHKQLVEMTITNYRGSASSQRMIVREIKSNMNHSEFRSLVDAYPASSAPGVQKRMPNLLKEYRASIRRNEIGKTMLEANHALVKGTIATATILSAPTGAGAVLLAGTSWVLDQTMAETTKVFDEHASKETRAILGHQLARYSALNPGLDLTHFKGKKPEEVLKTLEETSPIFDPALGEVKVEDRDLVQGFMLREIHKTIISGDIHLIDKIEQSADEIRRTRAEVTGVGKTLVKFAEKTNDELKEIKGTLGDIQSEIQEISATAKENQKDLRFIQNCMFGKMNVSEQRAALRAGMRDDLSEIEQAELDRNLALVEKQEKLQQQVQDYFGGASTLIGIAKVIPGVNPKLIEGAQKAVQIGQAAFAAGTVLASGNILQAAFVISGLFSGGVDPETQRHNQIMDKLSEISGQIEGLNNKIDVMLDLQKQTLEALKFIYKGIVTLSEQIGKNHTETMKKLDSLHQDVLYNRAILVDSAGISQCDTFLDGRSDFGFDGQDFPSYQALRDHFSASPNSLFFWNGFQALLKVFSFDQQGVNRLFGVRALEGRTGIGNDVIEPLRVWRETVYEPLCGFVLAYLPQVWTKEVTSFFSMFLLPAKSVSDLVPDPPIENAGDPFLLETSMENHMTLPLSPLSIHRCVNYLLQLFPYMEWTTEPNSDHLFSISELVERRDRRIEVTILRKALMIIEIAIAQQAILAGHMLLPLFERCYAQPINDGPDTGERTNMISSIQSLMMVNPLLRRNWVLYKFYKDINEKQISLAAYHIACKSQTDDSLWKTFFSFPWEWSFRTTEDGKRKWWHVQFGDKYEPVPTHQELSNGIFEYGDEMTMLLQLRSNMVGVLANYDFCFKLDNSMRETYTAALLHSV